MWHPGLEGQMGPAQGQRKLDCLGDGYLIGDRTYRNRTLAGHPTKAKR